MWCCCQLKGAPRKKEVVDPRQWNELAALEKIIHGVKELAVGTVIETPKTIFGAVFDDGLHIRQEYLDLHDIIQKRLVSHSSLRRILVVGNPGIGKSCFCCRCTCWKRNMSFTALLLIHNHVEQLEWLRSFMLHMRGLHNMSLI
ncbi:TPA: hypothetical protein N0F65_002127 [Lagenidium giganteum]|uniref:Uncharacterized protein n=1 Tax=Lagenidium giganteum TaxID=4803 RepID=A0AAV2ZEK9_9STRA|nr:TPA: hypothetical protein N0F65_002127 [Lagenidium giganteum]